MAFPVSDALSFRDLFESAHDAIFVVEAETLQVLEANQRAGTLLGWQPQDIVGQRIDAFYTGYDNDCFGSAWSDPQLADGRVVLCRLRARDGTLRTCEWSSKVIELDTGRYILGIGRDVTTRESALAELQLRDAALRSVSSGVSIADAQAPDYPLIFVNQGFETITGYSAAEATGRSCRFLQGDDRDQPELDQIREALRLGQDCNVRLRNYRKQGEMFWNELYISPVYDSAEHLTHFIGIQIDVTERVQSRQQLEISEARYRQLAASVQDMIVRFTPKGRYEYVSAASHVLLGYAPEELLEQDRFRLIHPEDRETVEAGLERLLSRGKAIVHSYRMRTRSGRYRWVESTDSLLVADARDRPVVASVVRDVTRRKRADEELKKALARERETSEIKSRFIRLVSHEFRTPLTGIRASASYLRDYGERLTDEKRTRHFQNIQNALSRMNRMLDDVHTLARANTSQLPFQPEPLDLRDFCEQLVEEMQTIYPNHPLDWSIEPQPLPPLLLDRGLLTHILQNLLGNALKYSPGQEPVQLRARWAEEQLVLSIEDRGIGIPEADQESLFEPFHRARNVGTVNGTGLGLSIVQRAVEHHEGRLAFTSTEGQGTTFTVELRAPVATKPVSL